MSDRLSELGSDTDVVLIMFGKHSFDRYDESSIAYPVALDPDRAVYRAYGLGRGSFLDVWGWATLKKYAGILRQGGRGQLESATEDTRQLAGDFVIAPDGALAWGYWGAGPADRPSVDSVIAAVHATMPDEP